jgi:hypothetical protein
MNAGYWFFIPKSVDKNVQRDLNRIFTSAIDSKVKGHVLRNAELLILLHLKN